MQRSSAKKHRRTGTAKGSAVIVIVFIGVVLCIVLLVNGFSLNQKILANETRVQELEELIAEENERTTEIEELEEYMQTDEYLEQEAKERLGFVKDGEIIFKENN